MLFDIEIDFPHVPLSVAVVHSLVHDSTRTREYREAAASVEEILHVADILVGKLECESHGELLFADPGHNILEPLAVTPAFGNEFVEGVLFDIGLLDQGIGSRCRTGVHDAEVVVDQLQHIRTAQGPGIIEMLRYGGE